jgi:hypothetical protein
VFDLSQAKEIIGKTVELEFKTQYTGDGSDVRASRQLVAEGILKNAVAQPSLMQALAANRQGDNIYSQTYTEQPLATLPTIYQENIDALSVLEPGSIYPTLLDGVYTEVPAIEGVTEQATTLEGRTAIKYNGSSVSV